MNDIRQRALEKARQRETASAQSDQAFVSERERAKEALRQEISQYTGQNVHKIAAMTTVPGESRTLRVCAYDRVSTPDIEQVTSLEFQKREMKDKITSTPGWIYFGTYVDDGFSGTNTEHRPAFQLMMKHAEEGRFDMIVTKSVSRFARNLVDCITWIRVLQAHDPPVAVYFEQEGINTLNSTSNIILFVLAMVAEEESHMKSEAMLLSIEWRFSRGRFSLPHMLGYDRIVEPDGNGGIKKYLRINEDEADTVRLIYYLLVNGYTTEAVAHILTDLGRPTGAGKGRKAPRNTAWTYNTVLNVARNEKYCGDYVARKTWTPDFHTHLSRKNRGNKNKYFQANHHEAIVPRGIWNAVQRILNSSRPSDSGKHYQPMRVVDHGALRGYISMNRFWGGFTVEDYLYICSVAMGLKEGALEADLENEYLPEGGFRIAALNGDSEVLRITRQLTQEELRMKAELEGSEAEPLPVVQPGFQVVSGSMFCNGREPYIRLYRRGLTFSEQCVRLLGCSAVELLLNPIERKIALRPCGEDHPNAIPWTGKIKHCAMLEKIFYELMGWEDDCSYVLVPIEVSREGQKILLFDMENTYGTIRKDSPLQEQAVSEAPLDNPEEFRGIFFGADDDPLAVEEDERIKNQMAMLAEAERMTFGISVLEHERNAALPEFEGDWDLYAEARPLDGDHRVDEEVIDEILDRMAHSPTSDIVAASAEPVARS